MFGLVNSFVVVEIMWLEVDILVNGRILFFYVLVRGSIFEDMGFGG